MAQGVVTNLPGPHFLEKVLWDAVPCDMQSPTASRASENWRAPFPSCYHTLTHVPTILPQLVTGLPPDVLRRRRLASHRCVASHATLLPRLEEQSTSKVMATKQGFNVVVTRSRFDEAITRL